ncbi:MAG: carboxypeptidase-like regulatory domain-containing protein [Bacteroidales bacterium]
MKKFNYLIIFLVCGLSVRGQTTLQGHILDVSDNQPLSSANIRIKGTNTGCSSRDDGAFELMAGQLPVVLEVSYLNYKTQTFTVSSAEQQITILMKQKSSELPAAEVSAQKLRDLIKDKPLYVYDYAFYGDSLMLLTYPHRRQSKATLVLLNSKGKELLRRPVKRADKLFDDKLGNVHLFTRDSVFQLFVGKQNIHLLYPAQRKDFLERMEAVTGSIGSNYYVRAYSYKDQVMDYFRYDYQQQQSYHFCTISSEHGLNLLQYDFYWRIAQEGFTEADLRFEEMAFYSPVFAPMVTLDDSVVILNYPHDSLEIYRPNGEKISATALSFHHDDQWQEELIVDRAKGKVYALFDKSGMKQLKKINLQTGETGEETDIPGFRFVEKIKVKNDQAFFLYKDFLGQRYKKIYRMAVGGETMQ